MTITELSIKRPSLIIIIFAALMVLGLFSYQQLQYELLPKFSAPIITVMTVYPGGSPNEVETGVSKPIEDALSGMDKISSIRSTSSEGVSFVIIELTQSAKIDVSMQDALRKISEVTPKLPSGAKTPAVSKIALDEIPVLRLGATANLPTRDFYQYLTDQVKPQISKIAGVGQIVMSGGEEREIKINLDQERIKSFGLSILQVTQSIKNSNLDFPTGKIEDTDGQYIVRVAGKFTTLEMIKGLAIGQSRQGGIIYLSDVAEVQDGIKDPVSFSRLNLKPTLAINIQKQSDANAVEVAGLVKEKLKELEEANKNINLKFEVAQDGSLFTIDAANAVKFDLAVAVLLVGLVMLLFLHSLRNSVIVLVAVPASLISTFIAIYVFGFTLNLMTLLALSLVVGILVDDSIVVLENIYHYLEKGVHKREAALIGRNEIGFAALAITLVDVAVFLPLGLVSGIIGNIMRQFSIVIVVSTLMSLFVSFTITPMLASRFGKLERLKPTNALGRFAIWFENKFQSFSNHYIKLLKWAMNNRVKVAVATVIMLVSSFALIPSGFIGTEFMTQSDRGEFAVTVELPPGSTLDNTNKISHKIESQIVQIPEVQKIFANIGVSNEGMLGSFSNNVTEINVTLIPRSERKRSTDEVGNAIKEMVSAIPGVNVRVNPIGIFGTANMTPIQMLVSGTDIDSVNAAAKALREIVHKIPGTADVRLSSEEGKPETRVIIDREKLSKLGLSLAEVGATLRVALSGDDDSKYRDGNNEYSIRIQLDKFDRLSTQNLAGMIFTNRTGQDIELQQFATLQRTSGPTKLQRNDRNSSVTLFSQAAGRASGSISQDIEKEMKKMQFPAGVSVSFSGDVKNQRESFSSLLLALIAAVLFTYMIMVALYDSFIYPFIVLFSIPLAMIGALLALALFMKSLNIFSILGIIMLVGLVGKNAILLVDRASQKMIEGSGVVDALLDAGKMRLRPIMMTTLTMIFGMMPIALSSSSGSEWKSGLAWALIGGLTSSLFLTLIVVPLVYLKVEELRVSIPEFLRRKFGKRDSDDDIDSDFEPVLEKVKVD